MKIKYYILITLFLISLASSIFLIVKPVSQICSPNEGCDLVLNSKYSSFLSIKNSYYGLMIFPIIIILSLWQIKNNSKIKRLIVNYSTLLGAIVGMYFLYLQKFIIKAFCKYCLVVDVSLILAAIIVLIFWKDKK